MFRRIGLPDFRRSLRELSEIILPTAWREQATLLLERIDTWVTRTRAYLASLEQRARDLTRHPGNLPGAELHARGRLIIGGLLIAVDIPLQAVMNAGAAPQVPFWVWMATAPAFALGLAAVIHGAALSLYDPVRPARSIRVVKTVAWGTLAITMLAFSVLMFLRVATAASAEWLTGVASISTWVLTEIAAITGGCFLAWWHFLRAPRLVQQEIDRVRLELVEGERHAERLRIQLAAASPAASEPLTDSDSAGGNSARAARIGVAAALLLMTAAAPRVDAQEPSTPCAIAIDRSYSLQHDLRSDGLGAIRRDLVVIVRAFRCGTLLLLPYTDGGAWTPRRLLQVPRAPMLSDCAHLEVVRPAGREGLVWGFKAVRDAELHRQQARCRTLNDSLAAEAQIAWRGLQAQVDSTLCLPQVGAGVRTDITGLLASIGPALLINLTDGLNSAPPHASPFWFRPTTRHVMVLVPARPEYGGASGTEEAAKLWREKGALTIPVTMLADSTIWGTIVAELRQRPGP